MPQQAKELLHQLGLALRRHLDPSRVGVAHPTLESQPLAVVGSEGTEAHHLDPAADLEVPTHRPRDLLVPAARHARKASAAALPPYLATVRPASSWRASMNRRSESRFR